jgi:Domain of unknown function (DUF6249)
MQLIGLFLLCASAGLFVLGYGMHLKARRAERRYQLYQQAIEKGLDPSSLSLTDEDETGDPSGNLKAGVVFLATALAMLLGVWAADSLRGPWRAAGFAIVPALVGLALVFIHFAIPRNKSAR